MADIKDLLHHAASNSGVLNSAPCDGEASRNQLQQALNAANTNALNARVDSLLIQHSISK